MEEDILCTDNRRRHPLKPKFNVKDGTLLSSMSGITSKMSNVSMKGWKDWGTGLWGQGGSGVSATEGGPGESSSLLAGGGRARGGYHDVNEKPLLGSNTPSPDKDSWSSWGDEWGEDKKKSPHRDDWGSWSNENSGPDSPPQASEQTTRKQSTTDDWNTDDWGTSETFTSSSNSQHNSSSTTAASKKKKKAQKDKKSSKSSRGKSSEEAATGNLIDFGDDGGQKNGEGDGWDNEKWAEEDDEWQSLELSSSKKD